MNNETKRNAVSNLLAGLIVFLLLAPGIATSQVPVDENGVALEGLVADLGTDDNDLALETPLGPYELEQLAGPIALYPDDLLAIVLPASTYPLEIVQAARFLEQFEGDSSLKPDESWDESITALLNYPEVIRLLNEDIDWTWRLGEAVIAQQEDLIAAIESFRDRAYAAGNLKTDEYQKVSNDDGVIEIVPVDEEIIYVPYYEPEKVVVYQPSSVYYYYPEPYPVYYYPYPVGHHFRSGYFWGVTTAFSIGWNNRYLHVYHPTYWGHPYYGRTYYSNYYRRPSINVYNTWYVNNGARRSRDNHRDGDYWRPRNRSGARPHEQRVRNRHYPSGTDSRRDSYDSTSGVRAGRSRMESRDSGRLQLGLRQRTTSVSGAGATRARSAGNTNQRATVNRNTGTARITTGTTERRRNVVTQTRGALRSSQQSGADAPANAGRRQASGSADIRFRARDNSNAARSARSARSPITQSPAGVSQRRSRAASGNTAPVVRSPQRVAVQRQQPTASNVRPATPTRQGVSRTPTARTPATSVQRSAPAARSSRPAASRNKPAAVRERKETPSRSPRRERKRN